MEYPVLRYLDMIIGFAGVMLLAATVVTAATQLFSSTFYFRSRSLRQGVAAMIRQLDPAVLTQDDCVYLAELILRHPVFGRPTTRLGTLFNRIHNEWRTQVLNRDPLPATDPTDIIQRSELMMVLLELAAGQGPLVQGTDAMPAEAADRIQGLNFKLRKALVNNGIDDPKATLQAVRLQAIENEKNHPALAAHEWWSQALLENAASDFAGKIAHSFDNTMERVAENFKLKANVIAGFTAAIVVFSTQLDSVALLGRLNSDDHFRESLLHESDMWAKRYEDARTVLDAQPAVPGPSAAAPAAAQPPAAETRTPPAPANRRAGLKKGRKRAEPPQPEQKLVTVEPVPAPAPAVKTPPTSGEKEQIEEDLRRARAARREIDETLENLRQPRTAVIPDKVLYLDSSAFWKPGIWLSWVLLSLGAPFWYNVLKNALRFRTSLAARDDQERAARQNDMIVQAAAEPKPKVRGASA